MRTQLKQEGGLYTNGFTPKTGSKHKPLISVITVVWNGAAYLEDTILSVINQTYENLEYIVIDNCSDDGTVDIIKKYEHRISYWVSEPDQGIYDAMNKGIRLAHGEWLNFMNCGDMLYDQHVLSRIDFNVSVDLIIGNTHIIDETGNTIELRNPFIHKYVLLVGNVITHQSTFIRKKRQEEFPSLKILGDYYLWLKWIYKEKMKFSKIHTIIATYRNTGFSSANLDLWLKEELLIKKELTLAGYWAAKMRIFVKRVLPSVIRLGKRYIVRKAF